MTKPIQIWLTAGGPNPWKVVNVMEELEIPYELNMLAMGDVKKEPFLKLNPNGRTPAIRDDNTGLVLWESGAIIQYLIEQYDTEHRLSYTTLKERNECNQFLQFQMSGQGPYFGQLGWFLFYHAEAVPSAIERYRKEVKRVLSVLEDCLKGREWLVGDKMTYCDLAFVMWNVTTGNMMELGFSEPDFFDGFPAVKAWHERMTSRPAFQRLSKLRQQKLDEAGVNYSAMKPHRTT